MTKKEPHPITQVIEALETIYEACGGAQNLKYELNRALQHQKALFKYAKFKVGDRVKLPRTLTYPSDHGWKHCAHFMKKGAKATIRDVDYDMEFTYDIEFDVETWISTYGDNKKPKPVERKHVFHFSESDLKKA